MGFFPFDSSGIVPALLRAVQDLKAAVRFFYKDKLTANTYKIDTNNIFIGGSSAGAITALHVAYLNKSCEINPYIPQPTLDTYGGIEGNSGNQCYSSKIKGVISLCGALGKYGWIEPGDVPLCSMHGTADSTVLYGRGKANPGFSTLYLDGSRMLYAGTQVLGVGHNFYTWYGKGHVPYAGSSASQLAHMDTTVNFVRDYLVQRLGCPDPALLLPNTPFGTATPYAYTTCTANVPSGCVIGINEIQEQNLLFSLYPNPTNDKVNIVLGNGSGNKIHTIQITDISGKILKTYTSTKSEITIEKSDLNSGMYLLKVTDSQGQTASKKIVFY